MISANDVDEIMDILCQSMYAHPSNASCLKENLNFLLFPFASKFIALPEKSFEDYQRKAIALSILVDNHQIKR